LAESGDWTPFLVDGLRDAGGVAPEMAEQNRHVMLHYAYAEDHGLTLAIYQGPERVMSIEVQRRGPSDLDTDAIIGAVRSLGFGDASALRAVLEDARRDTVLNMDEARARIGSALGIAFPVSISCADLSRSSLNELQRRFPGGRAVLRSRRGKADHREQPSPNEWCPVGGLPDFMYLPLPSGAVEASELERHVHHWLSTGDFDVERQAGFWLHTAYRRALPSRFAFLADRIMNLSVAFPDHYEAALRQTLRAVLAVAEDGFDWNPYLARKAGEQRL
jgi:hypothetical protein